MKGGVSDNDKCRTSEKRTSILHLRSYNVEISVMVVYEADGMIEHVPPNCQ